MIEGLGATYHDDEGGTKSGANNDKKTTAEKENESNLPPRLQARPPKHRQRNRDDVHVGQHVE